MTEDLNNFHGYMPGGMYRPGSNEHEKKVIEAIDHYIIEADFDAMRYQRLTKIVHSSMSRMVEALKANRDERAKHYEDRGTNFQKVCYGMEKPIYDHLLSLGFPRLLLIK